MIPEEVVRTQPNLAIAQQPSSVRGYHWSRQHTTIRIEASGGHHRPARVGEEGIYRFSVFPSGETLSDTY
jgi:hypothetical protein